MHDYEPPDVLALDLGSIKRIIESGIPDFTRGFGGKVLEVEAYFVETLGEYASLKRAVHIALCDMQGPFDLTYLMLGERIYGDVRDHPNMVAELLDLLTETFVQFARVQKKIIGEPSDRSYQWEGYWAKGRVKITENAGAQLSGELYERICTPYTQKIFQEFGGGVIHIDKAAMNSIDSILHTEKLTGLSLRVSKDVDLDQIYEKAAERRVCLIVDGGFEESYPERSGMICIHEAVSLKEAKKWLSMSAGPRCD